MIEVLKQALEALELERPYLGPMPTKTSKAIASLRQAIKEHALREVQRLGQEIEQEPVGALTLGGIIDASDGLEYEGWDVEWDTKAIEALQEKLVTSDSVEVMLYTAPPQRKPLTDEQIVAIVREASRGSAIRRDGSTSLRIARAIEAAHGIKGET